jgi:hypothetical protein
MSDAVDKATELREAADAYFPNDLETFVRIARKHGFAEAGVGTKAESDLAELRRRTRLAVAIKSVLDA